MVRSCYLEKKACKVQELSATIAISLTNYILLSNIKDIPHIMV